MISVVIVDDHQVVCEGLRKVLDAEPDIKCVGVATDGKMALDLIRGLRPNVAIVDINMPGMDGIETTRQIKAELPSVAVLILTAYDYERYVLACLEAGADGYVLKKKMPCDRLTDAVRMVHIGTGTFDLDSVIPIMKLMAASQSSPIKKYKLSDREREVLSLAATGIPSKQIAATLNISELTVNSYFTSIFKKLGAQSRVEAVVLALKEGLIANVYATKKEF
jgi:DNA-binding NarL/FixJ family response regulator